MKFCPKCKTEKPLKDFHKHKNRLEGRTDWCKKCMSDYGKQRYSSDKVRIKRQHKSYYEDHKEQMKAVSVAWRKANPEKVKSIMRRHNHGIEPEEYDALRRAQKGLCAICLDKMGVPNIDHCHASEIIRGLLCRGCNLILGYAKDSPARLRKAAEYLEQFPQHNAEEYQTKRQKEKRKKN